MFLIIWQRTVVMDNFWEIYPLSGEKIVKDFSFYLGQSVARRVVGKRTGSNFNNQEERERKRERLDAADVDKYKCLLRTRKIDYVAELKNGGSR